MKNYLELIRIKHWLKNFLIFLPLFFSGSFLDTSKLFLSIIACFVFCFLSSNVYIINDLMDLENDRKHPIKENRPLASNIIPKNRAYLIIMILFLIFNLLNLYLYLKTNNFLVIIIPIIYLVINILYSYILKNIPLLDVIIIVFGFVLRVIYGGICTNIYVSKYLYLLIIFGSFYLAFGKRRGEIIKTNGESRPVLSKYTKDFLDKNMYVAYTVSLVCYILWCVDKEVVNKIGHDYIFWTIPLLMIIFELYSLDIENNSDADPIEVILKNKILLSVIVLYILLMTTLIYIV